jgi:hypothetical protein
MNMAIPYFQLHKHCISWPDHSKENLSVAFFGSNCDGSNGANKKAPILAPHCVLYFLFLKQHKHPILVPPLLYHRFHQLQALDGEWGAYVSKKTAGLVRSKIEYFFNYIL